MRLMDKLQTRLTFLMKKETLLNKEKNSLYPIEKDIENFKKLLFIIQESKMVLRTVISKLPEIGKKKSQVTDDELIKLIEKVIKDEKIRLLYQKKIITESMIKDISKKNYKKLIKEKLSEYPNLANDRIEELNGLL